VRTIRQDEILDLEQRIEEARRRAWGTSFTPSWFVFFKSQAAATMAASTQIYGEDTARFQVGARMGRPSSRRRAPGDDVFPARTDRISHRTPQSSGPREMRRP
jgi:hypothetical protein